MAEKPEIDKSRSLHDPCAVAGEVQKNDVERGTLSGEERTYTIPSSERSHLTGRRFPNSWVRAEGRGNSIPMTPERPLLPRTRARWSGFRNSNSMVRFGCLTRF